MTFLEEFIEKRAASFWALQIVDNKIKMDNFLTLNDPEDKNDPIYGVKITVEIGGTVFVAKATKGHDGSYGDFDVTSRDVVVNNYIFDYRQSWVELNPAGNTAIVHLKPIVGSMHSFGKAAERKFMQIRQALPLTRVRISGGPIVYAEDVQGKIVHCAYNKKLGIIEVQGAIDVLSSFKSTLQRRKKEMSEDILTGTYAHGLCAYVGKLPAIPSLINKIKRGISGGICCTRMDQYIGPIGVYLEGDVVFASAVDLFSWIDRDSGERFFDSTAPLCKNDPELFFGGSLTEVIVANARIVGFWCDSDFLTAGGEELVNAINNKLNYWDVQQVKATTEEYSRKEILQAIAQW